MNLMYKTDNLFLRFLLCHSELEMICLEALDGYKKILNIFIYIFNLMKKMYVLSYGYNGVLGRFFPICVEVCDKTNTL